MDLTNRELEVMTLLAKGLLDKEIAQELKISARTVQSYLRRIYIKTKACNRSNAVANYYRMKRKGNETKRNGGQIKASES